MGPRAATIAKLKELERRHRQMRLANRYLAAKKISVLPELGLSRSEIARLIKAGGYSPEELTKIRDTIRYYRTKSRRYFWFPDTGGKTA